jgi:RNA polymerase sigma-70 factor (ECF subfamily)
MVESVDRVKGVCENDEALVRAFQAGDNNAFDELVLRHKERIFNMCYRFFGDYEEANDSAQEVFMKVYMSLKGFRGESSFSTWLYRITVNICKNKLKSLRYRFKSRTVSIGDVYEPEKGSSPLDIADTSLSPADCLETKQRDLLIQRAINALPPPQKMVIVLRHIEGLSYEEIAEVTGFTLGTVKSKIARARLRLRDELKGVL